MQREGFWGMTQVFMGKIENLINLTTALTAAIKKCQSNTGDSGIHIQLEENGEFNFKPEFAKLYTAWSNFQQVFLASSLVSTELWYRFNGFGSLLKNQKSLRAVA